MLSRALGRRSKAGRMLLSALEPLERADRPAGAIAFSILIGLFERWVEAEKEPELEALVEGELEPLRALLAAADLPASSTESLRDSVAAVAAALPGLELPPFDPLAPTDPMRPLYLDLVPNAARRRLGEHYTPDWLAERLIDPIDWPGADPDARLLDPACGSGTFLLHALARCKRAEPAAPPARWLERLAGIDLQPLAVRTARLNLRLALRSYEGPKPVEAVVRWGDALSLEPGQPPLERPFTHLLSNPPWVRWENLPEALRNPAKALWEAEGLFLQSGWRARMGAGKKDLSMLFVALAASRWLAPGGRLGMVLPRSLVVSEAAKGLRHRIRTGLLELTRLEDLSRLKVFPGANAPLILLVARRPERDTSSADSSELPSDTGCPWIDWRPGRSATLDGSLQEVLEATTRQERRMATATGQPGAPWVSLAPEAAMARARIAGPAAWRAWEGANSGGANGILWLEVLEASGDVNGRPLLRVRNRADRGRRPVPTLEAWLEADFVWPLLRGRDVQPWFARPSSHLLLVQDPRTRRGIPLERLEREGPLTLTFLRRFEPQLAARPLFRKYFDAARDAWYSIYNVGPYTLAPWKVVWREQGRRLTAAVVGPDRDGRAVVPDHKLMLVACREAAEAHFLCAVLSSPIAAAVAARVCQATSIAPHLLEHLAIPAFDPGEPTHRALSALSSEAHAVRAAGGTPDEGLLEALAVQTAALWGLDELERRALTEE